jgi:hypothetical protein
MGVAPEALPGVLALGVGTVGSAVALPLLTLGDLLGDIDEVVVVSSRHEDLQSARAQLG